jgi:hypothetical protein
MNSLNMSLSWSGMTTQTVRADFDVAVTLEDIVKDSYGEISLEELVTWTVDQLRAYVEENMLVKNSLQCANFAIVF